MDFHFLEFLRRQLARLRENMLRYCQLSDIMQQRGRPQGIQFGFVQTHFFADLNGIVLHAAEMLVGGLVLGFNRQRERLDGADVKSVHLLDVNLLLLNAFFLGLQPADVKPVRAINRPGHRHGQQGKLPAQILIHPVNDANQRGAQQVVGKGPNIAFLPHLGKALFFRHRNCAGDRDCVGKKVCYGG